MPERTQPLWRFTPGDALSLAALSLQAALAWEAAGWPSAFTWVAAGITIAVIGVARLLIQRVAAVGLELPAIGVVLALVAVSWRQPVDAVQLPWLCLLVVPLTLLRLGLGPVRERRRDLFREGFLGVTLAAGILSAESWYRPLGQALLVAAGFVWVVLWAARALERPRSQSDDHGSPFAVPGAGRLWGGLAVLAAAAMLLTVGAHLLFREAPRWFGPKPSPAREHLASSSESIDFLGLSDTDLPPTGPQLLALARRPTKRGTASEHPKALYLQLYLLEDLQHEGDHPHLTRRGSARSEVHQDEDDGKKDRRITVAEGKAPRTLEITLLAKEPTRLLTHPQIAWLEGDVLHSFADGSWLRPRESAPFTYRVGGHARRYTARRVERARAAMDEEALELPLDFSERQKLQSRVDRLLAGVDDDLLRAQRIEQHLGKSCALDRSVAWTDSYISFLHGVRAGNSSHFAQTFAVLARLAGLPTRVTVGYRATVFEEKELAYLIRAEDLHCWNEVLFEDMGWVYFDASPLQEPEDFTLEPVQSFEEEDLEEEPARTSFWQRHGPKLLGLFFLALVLAYVFLPERLAKTVRPRVAATPLVQSRAARRAWKYWQQFVELCLIAGLPKHEAATASEFLDAVRPRAPGEESAMELLRDCYLFCRFGGGELRRQDEKEIRSALRRLPDVLQHSQPVQVSGSSRHHSTR